MPERYLDYMLDMVCGYHYIDSLGEYELEELLTSNTDTAKLVRRLIQRIIVLEDKVETLEDRDV